MSTAVAVGIFAAIATRGVIAWADRRREADVPLETRIARAVACAEAEAAAQDAAITRRRAAA